ncbi:MAG: sigma-70 family RNA polymerase sigma factor [Candidatus Moraniibacteriota bacterium]
MEDSLKEKFDRLPGSLLITDKRSKVIYANTALERRTGFAVGEIVGKKPGELWGGQMGKGFYRTMWETIGVEAKPFTGTVRNSKKDGTYYTEPLFIAPIKDRDGETQYFAEIHPELAGRSEEGLFEAEFQERAQNLHREKNPLSWIFRSLQRKKSGILTEIDEPRLEKSFPDLASLFYELLVQPIEKVFLRRHEDALLIELAQKDPIKFSSLYEKYYFLIREYFLRRVNYDRETAEDLSQEVFSQAFRYLPTFRITNASYYTYLLRVAHNILVNYYRKQGGMLVSRRETALEETAGVPEGKREVGMENLLSGLPEKESTIMLMKYQDGLRIKEIAERVGKTENAVKLILSRTRRKLQRDLF